MTLLGKCSHHPCASVVGMDQDAPISQIAGHVVCRCGETSPHVGNRDEGQAWMIMHKNEPDRKDIKIGEIRGARFGQAGQSLSSSAAHEKFGKTVIAGQIGEKALAAKLQTNPKTRSYDLYQSLGMPTKPGRKRYNSDVDMVLANGNRVVLIDAKNWSANKFYWSMGGTVFENFGVKRDRNSGEPVKTSKNMDMAVNLYNEYLPGVQVLGMVVFVPTKAGLPTSVKLLRWPGGIGSYLPNDAIRKITNFLGAPQETNDKVFQRLNALAKR